MDSCIDALSTVLEVGGHVRCRAQCCVKRPCSLVSLLAQLEPYYMYPWSNLRQNCVLVCVVAVPLRQEIQKYRSNHSSFEAPFLPGTKMLHATQ